MTIAIAGDPLKVRALVAMAALALAIMLCLSPSGCAVHYPVHPGALNTTDSAAYDTLRIAESLIDQTRTELQAGRLPSRLKDPLNTLIRAYNVARESWLSYRAAIASDRMDPESVDRLNAGISDLVNAIRTLKEWQ
jgi:hypothetical protein